MRPHRRGRASRLDTGVTAADNRDIVMVHAGPLSWSFGRVKGQCFTWNTY